MISIIKIIRWNSCWNYGNLVMFNFMKVALSGYLHCFQIHPHVPDINRRTLRVTSVVFEGKSENRFPGFPMIVANCYSDGLSAALQPILGIPEPGKHWNLSQLSHDCLIDFRQGPKVPKMGGVTSNRGKNRGKKSTSTSQVYSTLAGREFWTIPYHTHVHFG